MGYSHLTHMQSEFRCPVPEAYCLFQDGYTLIVYLILRVFYERFCKTHHKLQNTHYTLSYFIQISCFVNAGKK